MHAPLMTVCIYHYSNMSAHEQQISNSPVAPGTTLCKTGARIAWRAWKAWRPGRCGSRSVQAASCGMRYALTCFRTLRTCIGLRGNTPAHVLTARYEVLTLQLLAQRLSNCVCSVHHHIY